MFLSSIQDFSMNVHIEDNDHKSEVSFDTVSGYDHARMDQCYYFTELNRTSFQLLYWLVFHIYNVYLKAEFGAMTT